MDSHLRGFQGVSFTSRMRLRVSGHVKRSLISGVILLIPIALTYLVVKFLFDSVDGILRPVAEWVFGRFGIDWTPPGPGLVLAVILIYLAGAFVAFGLGRRLVERSQGAVIRVPFVGMIYSAANQLVESFSGTKETGFKRVVLIEFPRDRVWSLGFLTEIATVRKGEKMAVVYIPTAPMPSSGFMALIPLEDVLDTDLSMPDAMQMVFSAGIVSPESINTTKIDVPTLETEARQWHSTSSRHADP